MNVYERFKSRRGNIERLFFHDYKVERKSYNPDGKGNFVFEWEEVQKNIGVLRRTSMSERIIADQFNPNLSHILYTKADANIKAETDRIIFTFDKEKAYFVIGIRNPSLMDHHLEINLEEMTLDDIKESENV